METIILVGGLGTRLRSIVSNLPKCMAPIAGKPFLWHLFNYLDQPIFDIQKVVLAVGYKKEYVHRWLNKVRRQFSFSIEESAEDEPLGTGGAIKQALSRTSSDDVLILNGDTFFDINLHTFMAWHQLHNASSITLALKHLNEFSRYGQVNIEANSHRIIAFQEKCYCKEGLINGGIYIINRHNCSLENYPNAFSFEQDVLIPLATEGRLYGLEQTGFFIDIGIPEDYEKAQTAFSQHRKR